MRVKLLLEIEGEPSAEEIAIFNKGFDQIEEIGLSLAEAKNLLSRLQRRMVEAQVVEHKNLWGNHRGKIASKFAQKDSLAWFYCRVAPGAKTGKAAAASRILVLPL